MDDMMMYSIHCNVLHHLCGHDDYHLLHYWNDIHLYPRTRLVIIQGTLESL